MDKTTDELTHEIKAATDVEDFLAANRGQMLTQSLAEYLNALLMEKDISRADVVRGSLIDHGYVYEIFSGKTGKTPSRDKIIALAFGLGLSAEETQKLLKLSGNRELYPRDKRDALILFTLQKRGDILAVNDLLHSYELETLGMSKKESL